MHSGTAAAGVLSGDVCVGAGAGVLSGAGGALVGAGVLAGTSAVVLGPAAGAVAATVLPAVLPAPELSEEAGALHAAKDKLTPRAAVSASACGRRDRWALCRWAVVITPLLRANPRESTYPVPPRVGAEAPEHPEVRPCGWSARMPSRPKSARRRLRPSPPRQPRRYRRRTFEQLFPPARHLHHGRPRRPQRAQP